MPRKFFAPAKLQDTLSYPPRAMRAARAAAYLDISKSKFLQLVKAARLPKPIDLFGVKVWDRLELDAALDTRHASLAPHQRGGESIDRMYEAIMRHQESNH